MAVTGVVQGVGSVEFGRDRAGSFGEIGAYDPVMSDDSTSGSSADPPAPPPDREAAESDELDELGDLDEREAARIRRRDRDAEAEQRELLRPGMGKVFKQILDAQAKAARSTNRRGGG